MTQRVFNFNGQQNELGKPHGTLRDKLGQYSRMGPYGRADGMLSLPQT